MCNLITTPVILKRLNTGHFQLFFYLLLSFRCYAMWRLCLGNHDLILQGGEKIRLRDFHGLVPQKYNRGKKSSSKSGWQINKNVFLLLLKNVIQSVFRALNESLKPKKRKIYPECSVHILSAIVVEVYDRDSREYLAR